MKTLVEKFSFDTTQSPPVYCSQTFVKTNDGLEHYIDGSLRAQVQKTSVVEYLESENISQMMTEKEIQVVRGEFTDF